VRPSPVSRAGALGAALSIPLRNPPSRSPVRHMGRARTECSSPRRECHLIRCKVMAEKSGLDAIDHLRGRRVRRRIQAQVRRQDAASPSRATRLVGGEVPSVRNQGQHPPRCDPPPPQYTDLEVEASLKCRSCRKGKYPPPVHMIRLTEQREVTPYVWVHPDEER